MRKTAIKILQAPIRAYQLILSPWIGGQCRFTPTCSHYALEALETHGPVKGLYLSVKRVCRCNPWGGRGGHDPVPRSID